jgi:glucose/arabinose dehydrogenase
MIRGHIRHGAAAIGVILLALAANAQDAPLEKPKVPAPDARAAEVPPGYLVEVAHANLMYPTSVELDDAGHLYVAESGYIPGDTDKPARVLRMAAGDVEGKKPEIVADKLSGPINDILWHEGKLYISHKGKISVLDAGQIRDLVTDLPSFGDHGNNQLSVGPDGKLYFGQGSATNSGVVGPDNFQFGWPKEHPEVCDRPARDVKLTGEVFESGDPTGKRKDARSQTSAFHPFGVSAAAGAAVKGVVKANGTILRMNLDGTDLEVYAWGFRNPYGVLWSSDGKLYVADAGSDVRGSRPIANVPEKLWLVKEGAWYGWPDFEAGIPVTDARYKPKSGPAPRFLMAEHPPVEQPFMTLEPHASITKLDMPGAGGFGFDGHLFMASSGDESMVTAERPERAGYWVKRIDPAARKAEIFFRARPDALGPKGLEYVTTAGPKRLIDVRFAKDGRTLYVADIGAFYYVQGADGPQPVAIPNTGVVWRITKAK